MKRFSLANSRNPLWPWLGGLGLAALGGFTGLMLVHRPEALAPTPAVDPFKGMARTRQGTFTERLGQGTFVLAFREVEGDPAQLDLRQVHGTLTEPQVRWEMDAPGAQRRGEAWVLGGPLAVEARQPDSGALLGRGRSEGQTGVLQWQGGTWTGLAPLVWTDHGGQIAGTWHLPEGWHRTAEGRFRVARGPVTWVAAGPGALRRMEAQAMDASFGLGDARLEGVQVEMEGGRVQAAAMVLDPVTCRWEPPIRFQRTDGWEGGASSGEAPRPPEGQPLARVRWAGFQASRPLHGGREEIQAEEALWEAAGLRLAGGVRWGSPMEPGRRGEAPRVELQARTLAFRETAGGQELPADLPPGMARAEGEVRLRWGQRSLESPRVEARQMPRHYIIHAPSRGQMEYGTFQAGRGEGTPRRWVFEGPVEAILTGAGTLRGGRLVWEGASWSLEGRPVTFLGLTERLSGGRVLWQDQTVIFPEGLHGAMGTPQGEMQVRAARGTRRDQQVELTGAVEVRLGPWSLRAQRVEVRLDARGQVVRVEATGGVDLVGSLGRGHGDRLVIDLQGQTLTWDGRVRGQVEMQP